MTPEELAAIRERHRPYQQTTYPVADRTWECASDSYPDRDVIVEWPCDAAALLAHIDAITEAVEGLRTYPESRGVLPPDPMAVAVLDLLEHYAYFVRELYRLTMR